MVLILLRRGSNGKRPDPPSLRATGRFSACPIHKESKKAPVSQTGAAKSYREALEGK